MCAFISTKQYHGKDALKENKKIIGVVRKRGGGAHLGLGSLKCSGIS